MPADLVSPELRAVEAEVDSAYSENPLTRIAFGDAAWCFLAFCEERMVLPLVREEGHRPHNPHDDAAHADELINHAKWPLRWLRQSCRSGERLATGYSDDTYAASHALSDLSSRYLSFESAFTYASMGLVTLDLHGNRITPSGPLLSDPPIEAYDRLVDLDEKGELIDLGAVMDAVADRVVVDGLHFNYALTPGAVAETLRLCDQGLGRRFQLPVDWRLAAFTLSEYAAVMKCLWAISAIHFSARIVAAERGCRGLGYDRALVLMTRGELARRLARYSGITESTVRTVIDEITWGRGDVRAPDTALQPIVPLAHDILGWAPSLVLNNALERNLIVLLNRTPEGRNAYSRVNQRKEVLLRSHIERKLAGLGFRFWAGNVEGWEGGTDVDLAIISDVEKQCLLLELKAFLAPAEPREIRDRSLEIARGVRQVKERKRSAQGNRRSLTTTLGVDDDFEIDWAVASETFIGGAWVQDPLVPVVRADDLVRRLKDTRGLRQTCQWLRARSYLPVEGLDFERVGISVRVDRWELAWHGIKGLRARQSSSHTKV